MSSSDERLHLLVDQNIADLNRAWPNRIPSHIARRLARPFAEELIRFDQLVEERGLVAGAEFLLRRRARGVEVSGRVPASGPVVVLANHPGLADAMALWKAIGREDLATLAAPRDLLRALPAVHARLREMEPNSGISGLRAMISELRKGRAVLTFPAGGIEPDPALEPDAAAEHRAAWPDFEPMLGRLNVPVVQAWVSGVHHPAAARIARALFPRSPDPAWTAATIQLLLPKLMKTRIRIEFRTWE